MILVVNRFAVCCAVRPLHDRTSPSPGELTLARMSCAANTKRSAVDMKPHQKVISLVETVPVSTKVDLEPEGLSCREWPYGLIWFAGELYIGLVTQGVWGLLLFGVRRVLAPAYEKLGMLDWRSSESTCETCCARNVEIAVELEQAIRFEYIDSHGLKLAADLFDKHIKLNPSPLPSSPRT